MKRNEPQHDAGISFVNLRIRLFFMAFASIYVPDFSIQAVVRTESALRQQPFALVDGCPPLERVVAINEAAARAGLDLGMTKSHAAQFRSIAIRPRSRVQEETAT